MLEYGEYDEFAGKNGYFVEKSKYLRMVKLIREVSLVRIVNLEKMFNSINEQN